LELTVVVNEQRGYAEKIKVDKPSRQKGSRTSGELKILG
jgi:hypothetical protein